MSRLYNLVDNPQEWLDVYHPNSISESVNSIKKKKFTVKVRKKPNERKTTEKILKVNMHKLRWYKHLKHTDQDWLSTVPNCA
jgi:transposase